MNLRTIVLIGSSFLISGTAITAQELTVTGTVLMASDSTAVPGASVRLRDTKGETITGLATKDDGTFVIQAESQRVSDLHITYVGLAPTTIGIKGARQAKIDLGQIYLRNDDKALTEVVVQGNLKQIDREIIFPKTNLVKASPDALTLLFNLSLSGLTVDLAHKTAKIRGKEIYWMINGVPKTMSDVLQLDPKKILRLEYSDLLSIRLLDKDQGGYINVILRERTDGGTVRTSLKSALWTGLAEAGISANYHRGKSDLTLDYTGSYRDYPRWRQDASQSFIKPKQQIKREENGQEKSPMFMLNQSLNLTYSYIRDKSNIFSLTWRNGFGRQSYDIRSEMTETGKIPYTRRSLSRYKGYVPALDAYYKHRFMDGGILETNLVGSLTTGKNNRDLTDKVEDTITSSVSNPVRNRYYSLVGEVSYQKLIHPAIYLLLGLQESYGRASNTYLTDDYTDLLDRNNTYLYGQISGRLSKATQYSLGTGLKVLYTADQADHRTFVKNQSSLALFYSPTNNWNFSFNSHLTPYLPALSQLSPVSQRYDDLIIYAGNPDLKPGTRLNNRLTASYRKNKLDGYIDLIYNHTFNPIYSSILYDASRDAFIMRPENGHFNTKTGAKLSMTWSRLFGFMTIVGNAGYNYFRSDVGGNPLELHDFYWDLSLMFSYKDFTIAGYYTDVPAALRNQTITRPGPNSGLTFIWNRETLTLYAQMLYVGIPNGDVYRTRNYSRVAPGTQSIVIPDNGNMLTLGLVWNVSFGKKGQRINRSLNNYDKDNSMVKVQE